MSEAFRFAAIGDSLTQGFQSGAIVKCGWSFPAIIARAAGLSVGSTAGDDFRVPEFPGDGLPLNVEAALRAVAKRTGPQVSGHEWLGKVADGLADYVDTVEDLYERGAGSRPLAFNGVYHNLAIFGHTVFEAMEVNSKIAGRSVREQEGWLPDDPLGVPAAAEDRVAARVLNPAALPARAHATQLTNLDWLLNGNPELGIAAEPLDALLVWLGANDCLETVVSLEIRDMADSNEPPDDVFSRRKFNLTSVGKFEADFRRLAGRIKHMLAGKQTRVFVGTVPDVTVPPITTGLGRIDAHGLFPYYARFTVPPSRAAHTSPLFHKTLSRDQVRRIQARVAEFNQVVRAIATEFHWVVVDTAGLLGQLAVRRNGADDSPGSRLQQYYAARPDHPLLQLDPIPSLLALSTDSHERRSGGGLISLDFVHPSTIGYGIVAEAFLEAMQAEGLAPQARIPWQQVIEMDTLLCTPPTIWNDVRAQAASLSVFWDLVARVLLR